MPPFFRATLALSTISLMVACGTGGAAPSDVGPRTAIAVATYDPSRDLDGLFEAVQTARVFPDSKTFVDARARAAPADIVERWTTARVRPGFDLAAFVATNFEPPADVGAAFTTDGARTMEEHIRALWPLLTRPPDTRDARSSLIALPEPYVVPGGRFREVYYWDSYFTMLGLIESGRTDLVEDMLDNFAYLVRLAGHVPNGNRAYYLSRSQPPFFAAMIGLYASATDTANALAFLDALEAEHAFWMDGADRVAPGEAYRRVVRMRDGSVLNRYWDDRADPRPESFREDWCSTKYSEAATRKPAVPHAGSQMTSFCVGAVMSTINLMMWRGVRNWPF
jgi:alpha,alpha-trehalase